MKVLFDAGDFRDRDDFVDSFSVTVRELLPEVSLTPLFFGEPTNGFPTPMTDWEPPEFFSINGALSGRHSPEVLNQMVHFQSTPAFGGLRFLGLKMLNRIDFTGTFRFLEREVIVHSQILAAFDLLLQKKPTLVVFQVTPHEFVQFILAEIAKFLEIEVLHFQPCSIAPVMIPRYSSGKKFGPAPELARDSVEIKFTVETVRTQLRSFQDEQTPSYMVQQRRRDQELGSIGSRVRAAFHSIRWIFYDRFPTSVDFSGHSNRQSFATRFLKVLLTRSLQRNLAHSIRRIGKGSSPSEPFALLALHYEPERTSLPDGLPIEFQGDAVLQARAFLPPEIELIVKEHYSQQSSALRGFLGRSPLFYDLLEGLPGTRLMGYDERLTSLVREARCVFTLTGTVAIEAVLRGTPVVYFGTPWWEGMPGTFRISELESFADLASRSVPGTDSVFSFLENLVLQAAGPGKAGEAPATIAKRFGPLPFHLGRAEGAFVAACVVGACADVK